MLIRALAIISLLIFTGCSTASDNARQSLKLRDREALLTVYMTTSGPAEIAASLTLKEVAVEVDAAWIALALPDVEVDYLQAKTRQQLIGAAVAPQGEHRRLRLRVVGLPGNEDQKDEVQEFVLSLPEPLTLRSGESKCLFVDLQLASERPGSQKLIPRFTAWGQGGVLGGELLYVLSPQLSTIYQARTDSHEVVASVGVPGPLEDMQLDDRRRLFVLSSGRRSIYVYDCASGRIVDQIPLPATVSPGHMVLSSDFSFAYVTDSGSGEVLKIDLSTGNLDSRVRIGHRPQRLAYFIDGQEQLAVVSPNSQQVFILDANNLQLLRIIPVGIRPVSVAVAGGVLYVAEAGTHMVSEFDPSTGQQLASIPVGHRPEFLLDSGRGELYVSNSGERSISILQANQMAAFRRIATLENPISMELFARKRLLYVSHPARQQVSVIDLASEQQVAEISLGGAPGSLAVLQ